MDNTTATKMYRLEETGATPAPAPVYRRQEKHLEHTTIEFNGRERDAVLIEGCPIILRQRMVYPALSDIPEPLRIRLRTRKQWDDYGYRPKDGANWIGIVPSLFAPNRPYSYYIDTDVEFIGGEE